MINSIGIVYLVPNVYFVLTIVGYRKFLATSSSCVFITRHAFNTKVGKEFQVFLPPNWPMHHASAAFLKLLVKSSVLNKFEFYCAQKIPQRRERNCWGYTCSYIRKMLYFKQYRFRNMKSNNRPNEFTWIRMKSVSSVYGIDPQQLKPQQGL